MAARDDYSGAIRDYSRALEIQPEFALALIERGWAYLRFDSPKLALVDFETAIKHDPSDSDAHNGRGTARAILRDHRAAVADAREAILLGKGSPRVTYNAARIYALAAGVAAADPGEDGRLSRSLSSQYQDIAVQLVREAFGRESPEKRAAFWRDTIQSDPALKAIRRRLKYEELIAANKNSGS